MLTSNVTAPQELQRAHSPSNADAETAAMTASAVSWGAIAAGAAAAAALSLILLILGTGLGLSSVSPWAQDGISAATFGVSTILWITFTQIVAAGAGGYLAGRLRTRWAATNADEVYFRDTAHGFLAWAVASLATAALLTTVIGSIVGGGVKTGAAIVGGAATTAAGALAAGSEVGKPAGAGGSLDYVVDTLFRKNVNATATAAAKPSGSAPQAAGGTTTGTTAEVTRVFAYALRTGTMPAEDVRQVGHIVAQRTGLTQPEAEKRVTDTLARFQTTLREAEATAKEAADKARKASAYAALWLFISLLIGAFVASLAATYGGRQRDL